MQAMARVYRQGQKKPCYIYRMFTSGTVEEVVYQRQTQKQNLSTLTVDGQQGSSKKTAGFTKEELRDCFTLKVGCSCDTKRKVGSKWDEYEGSDSLQEQGCTDAPLLSIAEECKDILGFVHIIPEEESKVEEGGDSDENDDESGSEDEEDDDFDAPTERKTRVKTGFLDEAILDDEEESDEEDEEHVYSSEEEFDG